MDKWQSGTNHIYRESPWLLFPELDWSALTAGLTPDTFFKGSYVYHQNQTSKFVYLIKSGRVNISIINSDGKVRSLFICGEGALFGEISAFSAPENCAQAQVVTDSLIYKIDKIKFNTILMNSNITAKNTAFILAKKVRVLTAQMESQMFPDAIKRVVNLLLYLAGQYGVITDRGIQLNIKFSHQEVANLIGASRVTVTNAFRQLAIEGITQKFKSRLYILDKEKLKQMLKW